MTPNLIKLKEGETDLAATLSISEERRIELSDSMTATFKKLAGMGIVNIGKFLKEVYNFCDDMNEYAYCAYLQGMFMQFNYPASSGPQTLKQKQ